MDFQPTTLNERVESIDIIRGISLLGILLVNILAFYLPMPHIDIYSWFTNVNDIINYQLLDIYVQSSFYPMFSMLFGYGIAMQYMKSDQIGMKFYPFISKRLVVLFVLGLLHAILIWWGDILAMYAFCGMFLVMFIRKESKWLLTIGLFIYTFMHGILIFALTVSGNSNTEIDKIPVNITMVENSIKAYGIGSWSDAFGQRMLDLTVQMSPSMWISSLFTILPYMLIGAAAAKWKLIERAKSIKPFWISIAILCIGIGLFIKSMPYMYERTYLFEYFKVNVGGPILSIGYIGLIVCICMLPFSTKILKPVSLVGRMSLTVYIMQSIICSIIFYDFGFGLFGKVDVKTGILIAIAIFIVQMIIALLWFTKFRQGPLEAVVKKIIYRKKLLEN